MNKIQFESISIEVTKRCNLRCKFCYATSPDEQALDELTTDQMCSFLNKFRRYGGRRVLFTGGEIFLRSDLLDLIKYAESAGLMVDLFSNGTLMTPQDVEYVAKHVNLITISIDGPAHVHDTLRGKYGSFKRTIRSIELLHEANARFGIQTMIVPDNIDKLDWLIQSARRTKPMIIKLGHVSRMGLGRKQTDLWLSDEQMLRLKSLSGKLSEECNQFHTRVVTNIITAQEFKVFYPSFKHILQPWMLPDGRILSCYVCRSIPYWTFSTAEGYPLPLNGAVERCERLASLAHLQTSSLPYFDLLELTSCVAEDIAEKSKMNKC